ncbi:uncharacterized protein LOC121832751 [Peromyscus maniculatus bairdii]|uniref:uncharacterized protein LOC121832751 n=1 Tax=Peromyscus maniculatus bairdii TaxID=230844 RepID=UPI003FD35CA8
MKKLEEEKISRNVECQASPSRCTGLAHGSKPVQSWKGQPARSREAGSRCPWGQEASHRSRRRMQCLQSDSKSPEGPCGQYCGSEPPQKRPAGADREPPREADPGAPTPMKGQRRRLRGTGSAPHPPAQARPASRTLGRRRAPRGHVPGRGRPGFPRTPRAGRCGSRAGGGNGGAGGCSPSANAGVWGGGGVAGGSQARPSPEPARSSAPPSAPRCRYLVAVAPHQLLHPPVRGGEDVHFIGEGRHRRGLSVRLSSRGRRLSIDTLAAGQRRRAPLRMRPPRRRARPTSSAGPGRGGARAAAMRGGRPRDRPRAEAWGSHLPAARSFPVLLPVRWGGLSVPGSPQNALSEGLTVKSLGDWLAPGAARPGPLLAWPPRACAVAECWGHGRVSSRHGRVGTWRCQRGGRTPQPRNHRTPERPDEPGGGRASHHGGLRGKEP